MEPELGDRAMISMESEDVSANVLDEMEIPNS